MNPSNSIIVGALDKETEFPAMLSEQPVFASRGMVACAHYLATQAGVHILRQGGNAIDAAIPANATMTVGYPSPCSAGGECSMLTLGAKNRSLLPSHRHCPPPHALAPPTFLS